MVTKDRAAGDGRGLLALIGGNEDRDGDRAVLGALVRALPLQRPRVVVMTAASGAPAELWQHYRAAFDTLGAEPFWLDARDASELDSAAVMARLAEVDLVFLTGGDQHRLLDTLGDTPAFDRILQRHLTQGLAVAGTSAGASALGARMPRGDEGSQIAGGPPGPLPPGLGLWPRVVVDQHFSERKRLSRLIQFLGVSPGHVGVGLDEDTAVFVHPDDRLEVVGRGKVTVVAGGGPGTRLQAMGPGECWSLDEVSLHLLTAGLRLDGRQLPDGTPWALRHLLDRSDQEAALKIVS